MNNFQIHTGGLRNEKPLTQKQIDDAINLAVDFGMLRDNISYGDNYVTGHSPISDILLIGTDLYPIENAMPDTKNANSRITWESAIGHEIIGHREAALKGWTQIDEIYEEIQASIRAARFTPYLNIINRVTLLRDAISRLPEGVKIANIKHTLNILER